jgi:hypothetical protein
MKRGSSVCFFILAGLICPHLAPPRCEFTVLHSVYLADAEDVRCLCRLRAPVLASVTLRAVEPGAADAMFMAVEALALERPLVGPLVITAKAAVLSDEQLKALRVTVAENGRGDWVAFQR